jgi:hypothetical protein
LEPQYRGIVSLRLDACLLLAPPANLTVVLWAVRYPAPSRAGKRGAAMSDPRHEKLLLIVKRLPSDFEPWGEHSRSEDWGPDCSCGCRWFIPLAEELRYDWGVCRNPKSPRCGLLTFEHQGCREFEAEADREPNTEPPEHQSQPTRPLEVRLLLNLKARRTHLEAALSKVTDHWGFEDPVYRFYHQSFKVYWLQSQTEDIVRELGELLPGQPLNSGFLEIIHQGTGKRFRPEDNSRWAEVTRPILEAFFHARFFLEMAVRYGHLEVPPTPLPSGYAALLYLFGLR